MKKRNPNKNGIQKTTPVFLWISALFRPRILAGLGKTLAAIFAKFFFLQFQTVLFPKTRPVVNVDHPLDKNIPFDPSHVGIYNTFTIFWMKAAGWLLKEFGSRASSDIAGFANDMAMLYNSAGNIYSRCQSTTERPGITANFHFIIIHLFDPHLHCVPSLHVMVCAYTAFKTCDIIEKHADGVSRYKDELEWVYRNSLEIIESVLLVKQHSVNCIPAGYYMNSVLFEDFRKKWAVRYLEDMFSFNSKGIKDIKKVQDHMRTWYDKFIGDYEAGKDRDNILIEFLKGYNGVEIG